MTNHLAKMSNYSAETRRFNDGYENVYEIKSFGYAIQGTYFEIHISIQNFADLPFLYTTSIGKGLYHILIRG